MSMVLSSMAILGVLAQQGGQVTVPAAAKAEKFSKDVRIVRKIEYGYLSYVPEGAKGKLPLVVFLHGAGERGDDLSLMAVHGPFKELNKGRKFPFVMIAPQCPRGEWWQPEGVNALTEYAIKKYNIDRSRVYLTGISMGGYGTWGASAMRPDLYAAIFPICGGIDPAEVKPLVKMPIWTVHGDADTAVPIDQSGNAIAELKRLGANPRFDIIKGGGHDVWTDVYSGTAIYEWLLSHRKR